MKNINNNRFLNLIKSKALILIASSSLLTSCVIYTSGYSETDGVYYDPNKDSLPAGSYSYGNNQVDNYYNYQDTYPSIYDNNQQNIQDQENRYNLTSSSSDWGTYTGSETNYSSFNNWGGGFGGWGMGFGYGGFGGWGYPGYGMYGWNSPFNSWGWGMGFGWGNSFYSPWGWGGGFYDPFWGGGYGGWGNYYGGGYYHPINYNRSGANGGRLGGMISQNRVGSRNDSRFQGINNSRMRTTGNIRNDVGTRNSAIRTSNNGMRNPNGIRPNNGGIRTYPNNGGVRNTYPNNGGTRTQTYPNNGNIRTSPNNGGFRNESYSPSRSGSNSGGFNSGGGMRSGGSSSGGGMRSGGGGGRR